MKIDRKITIYFASISLCFIALNLFIYIKYSDYEFVIVTSAICSIVIGINFLYLVSIKKYMCSIFLKLEELVSALADLRETEVFSDLNDDMLSKLQSKVVKLINILKSKNLKMKEERDELQELVSDMSHQLRTPLSNLKIYYELLSDESLSLDEKNQYNFNIKNAIDKLSFLIQTMIKMSRLESGIIRLKPCMLSINEICLISIKQAFRQAKEKNIEIKFESKEDIVIKADKHWTVEAIFNIIENAIKYTNNGGIIEVKISKYNFFSRIDIKDNGIGIEEYDINKIFKRFYRGYGTQNEDGLGIGLYLSRKIIEDQNGYIKVKSKVGVGSIFSVFLLN